MKFDADDLHIPLEHDEQLVMAEMARVTPTLYDILAIFSVTLFVPIPVLFLIPILMIHYIFRPAFYVITTKRVLVLEPSHPPKSIRLEDIRKFRGTRKSLLIYTHNGKIWLPRLSDAWRFETVIMKTREITLSTTPM